MLPPVGSLVKYDNSVLVSASKDKKGKGTPGKKASSFNVRGVTTSPSTSLPRMGNEILVACLNQNLDLQGPLPPVEQKPGLTQTEDILNSILPPRQAWGAIATNKKFSIDSCIKAMHAAILLGSGQRRGSYGSNMSRARRPPGWMSSTCKRNLISSCSNARYLGHGLACVQSQICLPHSVMDACSSRMDVMHSGPRDWHLPSARGAICPML